MQFKDLEELQTFIVWAKEQKIESFKVKDVEFHFSATNFLPQFLAESEESLDEKAEDPFMAEAEYRFGEKTWVDDLESKDPNKAKEEDEDLYWSADGR